jgi:hypothetical protein
MGLDRETQQRLDQGAIEKLREAARGAEEP